MKKLYEVYITSYTIDEEVIQQICMVTSTYTFFYSIACRGKIYEGGELLQCLKKAKEFGMTNVITEVINKCLNMKDKVYHERMYLSSEGEAYYKSLETI